MNHKGIQVIGEEVISKFPELSGLKQDPHGGVCVLVCLSLPWADRALSGSIYHIALINDLTCNYQTVGQSLPLNYIVHEYGARSTNHLVVRFLYKTCSASSYANTGFINPSKRYRATRAHRIEKREGIKKYLFYKTNKRVKKKMIHEI